VPESPALQLLIAEDSAIVRERLVSLARQHLPASSICSVATGADAVAVFDRSSPDAVLLDLGLPDMTGLEVLEHIRRARSETEVIVFTNWAGPEMAARCHLLGANHFVSKGHDIAPVIEILRTIAAPRSAAPARPGNPPTSGGDRLLGTNPVHVLLVEDDDAQADLLVKLIPPRLPQGSAVYRAASKAEAVKRLREGRFEVILVDLGLPDSDGPEAVVALRLASPAAAIIVLSAHQDDATVERAMQSGADDYFIKGELAAGGIARAILAAAKRQRSARALTSALESRRRIMDSSVDVICTLDAAGRFVEVGAACERLWGYVREDLVGRILTDWIAAPERPKTEEFIASVRRGAPIHEFENQFVCQNGSAVDMMWSAVWSADDRLMYCVAHDITNRKRNEETLRATVTSALDCIITIDEFDTVLEFNPAAEQTFGWSRAEALGRKFSELVIPTEFRDGHADGIAKLLHSDHAQLPGERIEIKARHANGTEFPAELSLVRLGPARPARFTAFLRGISERVSAREKLEAQEEQYRVLFESNPNAMWVYELAGLRILAANDAAVVQYGYSHEEFLTLDLFRLRPPEDREAIARAISSEGAAARHAGTWKHLRKDGSLMLVDVYSSPTTFAGKPARMAVLLNVTEQKRADELVRESERAQRAIAAQLEIERAGLVAAQAVAKLGSWEVDLRAQTEVWSAESYRILELDPTLTATHQLFVEVVHPEDRAGIEEAFYGSLSKLSVCDGEHRLLLPDGRIKYVHQHWEIIRDEHGQPERAAGTIQDVTERVLANEARQREREFLSALVENVSDGIVACDAEGVLTFFNGATREFHGLPAEPVPAERWAEHFDLYLPDGSTLMPKEQIPLFRALSDGSVQGAEMVIAPHGRAPRRILASGRSFTNKLGETIGAVVAMHDVTKRRKRKRSSPAAIS
jgi:PAS domain S-box-containing protein